MVGIAQLKAQNSWYICSSKNTDYIGNYLIYISNYNKKQN